MADPRFFKCHGPFTLRDIIAWSNGALDENQAIDPETPIIDVAPIENPREGCVSYVEGRQFAGYLKDCKAAAVLLPRELPVEAPPSLALVRCDHPKFAFAAIAARYYPPTRRAGVHPTAIIDETASIGADVWIGPHVTVGAGAEIGTRSQIGATTTIGPGVRLGEGCDIASHCSIHYALIGDRVRIEAGSRIGESGFGWAMSREGHRWIPQLGRVLIGDDVYVGANCTIDRGAGPDTVIGNGVLIDNLVQIGHNVTIGEGTILAGTVGIAGSARIGAYALIGAGVGIADHVTIADGAQVVARSGVMNDVSAGEKWAGSPAIRARDFWRTQALLRRLLEEKGRGKR